MFSSQKFKLWKGNSYKYASVTPARPATKLSMSMPFIAKLNGGVEQKSIKENCEHLERCLSLSFFLINAKENIQMTNFPLLYHSWSSLANGNIKTLKQQLLLPAKIPFSEGLQIFWCIEEMLNVPVLLETYPCQCSQGTMNHTPCCFSMTTNAHKNKTF